MIKFIKIMLLGFACGVTSVSAVSMFELIVPNPPGGTTDMAGRYVAKILNDANMPTIVSNRPGAQGTIGTKIAAKTANTQNTLLLLGTGPGLYAPLMMDTAPYDVLAEFSMVATIASDSIVIIVPGTSTIQNAQQLITAIRLATQPLNWGHGAMSQKFAGILFMSKIKQVATEVPYNGAIQVVTAVASGHLDFAFINYTEAKELATTGRVRMIGVAAKQRLHQDSSIPTFYEQGIDFEHQAWFVLAAPKAMAPELVNKINQSVTSAMKKDQTSYIHREMTPMISTVAQSEQFIRQQYKTYRPIIQGVKSQANK